MTVYSAFSDSTQSKTIIQGNSVTFSADFFSMNPPITSMKVQLFQGNNLISTFLNSNTNEKTYSNTYNTGILSAGTYEIRAIGTDKINTDSETLTLTINPIVIPPTNVSPVITYSPVTSVNEGANYNYHVIATDADGDTLTYSLISAPSWLSINTGTGVISGTAPLVSVDTNYIIVVGVSDGVNSIVTETYTLTVIDTSTPQNPQITIISPEQGNTYRTGRISLEVTTNSVVSGVVFRLDEGSNIQMNNPSVNDFTYNLQINNEGTHFITFYPTDSSNNIIGPGETVSFSAKAQNNGGGSSSSPSIIGGNPPNTNTNNQFQPSVQYATSNTTKQNNSSNWLSTLIIALEIALIILLLAIILFVFNREQPVIQKTQFNDTYY